MPPLRDNLSNHSHEILIKKPCPNHQTNAWPPLNPTTAELHIDRSDLGTYFTWYVVSREIGITVELLRKSLLDRM